MDTILTFNEEGAQIADPQTYEKFASKQISPSLVTGLEGCHARWVAETFAIPRMIPDDQDTPSARGKLFHTVMEKLFYEQPENRTQDTLKQKMTDTLRQDDFQHLARTPEAVTWLKQAVKGYYQMGGSPSHVTVADVWDKNTKQPGLEHFVKGKIGNTQRHSLGFIDRVLVDPRESNKYVIEDWKTGAKAYQWKNTQNTSAKGFPEQRQQTMYSMLMEQQGYHVSSARLIYPVAQQVVTVDPHDKKLREHTTESVEKADEQLDHLRDSNTFELTPSFLCAWCPLAKICPEADIKKSKKVQDAFRSQPEPEQLSEGITSV